MWWQHNKPHRLLSLLMIPWVTAVVSELGTTPHPAATCSSIRAAQSPWAPLGSLQQGHSTTSAPQQKGGSSAQELQRIVCFLCVLPWYQSHSGSSDSLPAPPPCQTKQKGDKAKKSSPEHWLLCENCNCDLLPSQMDYGNLTLIKYCKLLIITSSFASMGNNLPTCSCV